MPVPQVRARRVGFIALALALVALGAFALTRVNQTSAAGAASAGPEATTPTPISPVVTVASGTEAGLPWALRVHLVEGSAWEGEPIEQGICFDWQSPGRDSKPSPSCVMGYDGSDPVRMGPISHFNDGDSVDPPVSSFIGLTPDETTAIDARVVEGNSIDTKLYGPFPEFGPAKFYVAFAPPLKDVNLKAVDQDGSVLWDETAEVPEKK